jgi:hypothetical protein
MWTLIKIFPSREEWNKTVISPGIEIIHAEYNKNKSESKEGEGSKKS